MDGKASKTLIGAFVVGAAMLITVGLLVFGSGKFMTKTQQFVLFFKGPVKGLNVGAPVLFGGVQIGSVKRISIEADAKTLVFYVPVIIEIQPQKIKLIKGKLLPLEKAMPMLIKKGLRAQLTMGSLITGDLTIELNYHPDTPVKLVGLDKAHPEIPTIPSTFQRLSDTLKGLPIEETLKKFMSAVSALEKLLESPDIPKMLRSMDLVLADMRQLVHKVDAKVDPLAADIKNTLAAYEKVAATVNAEVKPLADNAQGTIQNARKLVGAMNGKVEKLGPNIESALKASHEAMRQAELTLQTVERRLGKDSPLQNNLDDTLKEVSEMARSIRSLADYLSRHPEALIRGKK
ncbi:MAG: MlaD family protein [Desulfatiglandaceae bacterium]